MWARRGLARYILVLSVIFSAAFSLKAQTNESGVVYIVESTGVIQQNDNTVAINVFGIVQNSFSQDIINVVIIVTLSDGTQYSTTIPSMRSGASSPFMVTGPVTAGAGSYTIHVDGFRLTSTDLTNLFNIFWDNTSDISVRDAAIRSITALPPSSFEAVRERFAQTAPFDFMIADDLIEDLVLMEYLGAAQSPQVVPTLLAMSQIYSLPSYQEAYAVVREMGAGGSTIIPLLNYAYANSSSLEDLLIYTMRRNLPYVLPLLLESAYNAPSNTQAFAMTTLSALGYATFADVLSVSSSTVRADIIQVLGRIDTPDILMPLLRLAEESPLDRDRIVNTLVSWQGEITPEFLEMLNAPDPQFRAMITQIITQRGERDLLVLQNVAANLGVVSSSPRTVQDALTALESYYAGEREREVAALWDQAQASYAAGDCVTASSAVDSMSAIDQGIDTYYGQIVPILLCAGRSDDAVQWFTLFMANSPDLTGFAADFTAEQTQTFAEQLRNASRYDEAIAFLQSAREVYPEIAANELTTTYLMQANALRAEGRFSAADTAVAHAKDSAPTPTVFFLALLRFLFGSLPDALLLLIAAGVILVLSLHLQGFKWLLLSDQHFTLVYSGLFGVVIAFLTIMIHTPHIDTGGIINAGLGILAAGALCFGAAFYTQKFSAAARIFSFVVPVILLILLYSTGHDLLFLMGAGALGFLLGGVISHFTKQTLSAVPLFAIYLGFNLVPFQWSAPGADHVIAVTLFTVTLFVIWAFFALNSGLRRQFWIFAFCTAAIGCVQYLTRINDVYGGVFWLALGVIAALLWYESYRLLPARLAPFTFPIAGAIVVPLLSNLIPSLRSELTLAAFVTCVLVVVLGVYYTIPRDRVWLTRWVGVLLGTIVWHSGVMEYSLTDLDKVLQTILSVTLPLGLTAFFLPILWDYLQSPQRRFVVWDANRIFTELRAQRSTTHLPDSWRTLMTSKSDTSLSEHIVWMFASSEEFSHHLDAILQEFDREYLQKAPEAWQHLLDVFLDFREGQIPPQLLRYIRFVIWYEFLARRNPNPNSEFGTAFLNQDWAGFAELRRASLTEFVANTGMAAMFGISGASLLELPKVLNQRGVVLLSTTDDMLGTAGWRDRITQILSPGSIMLSQTPNPRIVRFDNMLSKVRELRGKLLTLFEEREKDPELQKRMHRVLDASYAGIHLMQTAVDILCDQGVGLEVIELTHTFTDFAFSQQIAHERGTATDQTQQRGTKHVTLLDQAFRAYDSKSAHALYNIVINRGWVKDAVAPNLQAGNINFDGKSLELLNTTFQETPLVVIARTPDSAYAFDLPANHGRVIPLVPGDYEVIVLLQTPGFAPGRYRFTYQENTKTVGWVVQILAPFNMPQFVSPPLGRTQ